MNGQFAPSAAFQPASPGSPIGKWRGYDATRARREPLRSLVRFTTAASGTLLGKGSKYAFQDDVNGNTNGGKTLVSGDTNFAGGVVPAGFAFDLRGLQAWIIKADGTAVPAEAEVCALMHNVLVKLWHNGLPYELGDLAKFMSPMQTSTTREGNVQPFRFLDPFELAPGDKFKVEAYNKNDLTAGVAVSSNYDIKFEFDADTYTLGGAATKQ